MSSKRTASPKTIGVVGLGYVGLPLVLAFAEAGFPVLGFDVDPASQGRSPAAARATSSTSASDADRGAGESRPLRGRPRTSTALRRGGRHHHLRAHAADRAPRAGPALHRARHRPIARRLRPGPARRPGEHHLPRHDRRGRAAASWRPARPQGGQGLLPGLQPRARGPGQPATSRPRNIPKVVGGSTPTQPAAGRGALRQAVVKTVVPVSSTRVAESVQDPREHLPRGQHRPGQRAEDALRPHGHRRLGGDRGGRHQALRLHALLSRARAWAGTASRSIRST